MDMNEIKRAETDPTYWKERAMKMWRQYIRHIRLIRRLRVMNRDLREELEVLRKSLPDLGI